MKKFFLMACFLVSVFVKAQLIMILDKGDVLKAPEQDMVVMDKYAFAKMNYHSEKYDTMVHELLKYDSLLEAKDSSAKQVERDYQKLLQVKDVQIEVLTDSYTQMKKGFQESIDKQNKLQVDYLKLQQKQKRVKRWRNFFMGTTALCGGIIYFLIAH